MRMLIVCAFFLWGSFASAQDLKLILKVEQTEMPVGIPIIINLTIQSEDNFTLPGGFGFFDEHTKVIIKDSSGNPTPIAAFDCEGLTVERGLFDSDAKKTYAGIVSTQDEMYLPAGSYKISAEYHSSGPYVDRYSDTDIRPVEGIWIGELTSNEVKVTVRNPEGDDQVAFQALRPLQEKLEPPANKLSWFLKLEGKQILQDYPKSNYATWVLWKKGESNFSSFTYYDKLSVEEEFNLALGDSHQGFSRLLQACRDLEGACTSLDRVVSATKVRGLFP